ncbi:MAG: serine hydrolase domain-containing protein [Candidatus Hydrogenedentota bacterium]
MFPRIRLLTPIFAFTLALATITPTFAGENLGLPTADPESLGMSSEKLDKIPTLLASLVNNQQVPGFVTVVARDGKVVHFNAFGSRDVEREKPMTPDTIFRMYSMTKPITGVAVMILVDEGKLKVTDNLSKYLPEFSEMTVMEVSKIGSTQIVPAKSPITVENLLMHTSGLIYGIFDGGPLGELYNENGINSDGSSGNTLEEFSKMVAKMPLKAHPGTEWNYSVSMDVLGRVVEVVTGQRYGDFLEERIFQPLGMKDAGFYVPAENADRLAANYGPKTGGSGMVLIDDPLTSAFLKVPSLDSGGGGSVGTAKDYLRFAQMLLNGGELDGVRIISEESAEAMTSDHMGPEYGTTPIKVSGFVLPGVGFGYTGAVVRESSKQTVFGGPGEYTWAGYASTDFWIDKKENIVGIVLTQLLPAGTYPQRVQVHNAVYAAITESHAK